MNYSETAKLVLNEITHCLCSIDQQQVQALAQQIITAKRIFVAGLGRSGLMVRGFAMRLMHMGLNTFVVSEMVTPAIQPDDLLLIASGSGKTASLVIMARQAKALGAHLALVTIFPDSSMGALADTILRIPAPSPKSHQEQAMPSCQPMGSLFEQSLLIVLDVIIMLLMEFTGQTSEMMFSRHANLE